MNTIKYIKPKNCDNAPNYDIDPVIGFPTSYTVTDTVTILGPIPDVQYLLTSEISKC